ncbi:hypothetical protein [Butyrivibrio hungatei]|uniref:PD-(D/E)XK nuclease superfamily protein n=1 Tax=Butyrivibrio hungatei TaxID=185008 RepID=A0A1D9P0A9_9FIRM|nr:hypothetical protein [Butyrivibrio hungatei]AOZ95943.1 hypothetical protein bhn_I0909 [Butyrivibrio hungatei]
MKKYSKREILDKCNEYINLHGQPLKNGALFYKESFVNYKGEVRASKEAEDREFYTEIVAEFLLTNPDVLDAIEQIDRSKYKIDGHDGKYDPKSNRVEEKLAMDMFNYCKSSPNHMYEGFGRIIDYQIPLKKSNNDEGVGKIDLLSKNDDTLFILELKIPDSKETMLRCALECYTYWKMANHSNLIRSYEFDDVKYVKAAPLVYYGGIQWQEMQENRVNLELLMKKLGIAGPFYYEMNSIFSIRE